MRHAFVSLAALAMGDDAAGAEGDGAGAERQRGEIEQAPPPPLRTNRTRRVLHPVLIGHAASCRLGRAISWISTV